MISNKKTTNTMANQVHPLPDPNPHPQDDMTGKDWHPHPHPLHPNGLQGNVGI